MSPGYLNCRRLVHRKPLQSLYLEALALQQGIPRLKSSRALSPSLPAFLYWNGALDLAHCPLWVRPPSLSIKSYLTPWCLLTGRTGCDPGKPGAFTPSEWWFSQTVSSDLIPDKLKEWTVRCLSENFFKRRESSVKAWHVTRKPSWLC